MAKIMITKEVNGAREEENVRIGRMKVRQLKKTLKKIQEIVSMVEGEESVSELMNYFMDMKAEAGETPEGNPDIKLGEEMENKIFMSNLMGAIKILLNQLPDEFIELISIISGLDEELIDDQDYDVLFDIIEAIIEENDINTIVKRTKEAFFKVRNKWGGLKAIKG